MLLIQIKGGKAADPTHEEIDRLPGVAHLHGASDILLAKWKKGSTARSFQVQPEPGVTLPDWILVEDIDTIFR